MKFALIASLLCALLLLGVPQIGSSSEAREAHIIQTIVSTGEWVLPRRNDVLPSKPVLHHWIGAAFSLVLARADVFTARLPSLISAFVVLLAVYICGQRAGSGSKESKSNAVGTVSVLTLASSYGFFSLAQDCRVDMTFCALVACAFAVIWLRFIHSHNLGQAAAERVLRHRDILAFFFFCALATLTKGPLGLVLPGLICTVMAGVLFGFGFFVKGFLRCYLGILLYAAIVLPWYMAAYSDGGAAFLARQLGFENLERFSGGEGVNQEAWWFYVPTFLRTSFPWSLIFIFICVKDILARRNTAEVLPLKSQYERLRQVKLALSWAFLAGLIFFSVAAGKRHSYLAPLYMLTSLRVGFAIVEFYGTAYGRKTVLTVARVAGVITAGLAGLMLALFLIAACCMASGESMGQLTAIPVMLAELAQGFIKNHSIFYAVVLFFSMLSAIAFLLRSNRGTLHSLSAGVFCCLVPLETAVISLGNGLKNEFKNFANQAAQINSVVPRETEIIVGKDRADELFDPLLYYLTRPVRVMPIAEALRACELESKGPPRVNASVLLTQQDEMLKITSRQPFVLITKLVQPVDAASGRRDREIIALRCEPAADPRTTDPAPENPAA